MRTLENSIMRTLLLASAAVLALGGVAAAQVYDTQAPFVPGQQPHSTRATNIGPSDTRSTVAPSLPVPAVAPDAGFDAYLRAASNALQRNQTGEAQEALERAETRLLDRSVLPSRAGQPAQDPRVAQLGEARQALAAGDTARAQQLIGTVMQAGAPPRQ
jgi:hypothetical protein